MKRLELTLLGGFQARLAPGDAVPFPTRKSQALLAFLVLPPGLTHPRDKLASLLWGDMTQTQARGNLRQALASLRRALGETDALRLLGETVHVDPAHTAVDVWQFERCAGMTTPEALTEAASLYTGDLLAGLTLREPPFEEWLVAQRERLHERAVEVMARLVAHQRRAGDADTALQTALKLLALDPLQEPVHRTLMRLYVELGRRGAALRQYQACAALLDREFRAQPEPETKALYQQILTERASPPAPVAAPSPRTFDLPSSDIPLVGRAAELARLTEALDAACSGRGQIAVLIGDPGVGKSRLTAEVVAVAARRGVRVVVGRCFETERRQPFAAWVNALRSSGVLADAATMDALEPVWRSELARVLPEVGAPPQLAREGSDPLHLFEAISRLLELIAREPLLLVFEDGHWVDEMSLRLFGFIARRIRDWRMLWLGTFREEEMTPQSRLRLVGDELAREGRAIRIRVAPLSRAETLALARHVLPPGTAERADDHVWRTSEGNAFMAVETARTFTERPDTTDGASLPGRVRDLVAGRLERLTTPSHRVAALAAVIGRQFNFALLHRASDLSEDDAAEAMEELVRRRIIQQSGDGFEFTHDRIREVAYESLLLPQRAILHRRVAEALEALRGADAPDVAGTLASHYRQAGMWPNAVHHLNRFAIQAAQSYAHGEAADALEHALDALARLPPSPERDRQQLDGALRRAQSLYFVGQWEQSVETLHAHATLLADVDDPSISGPWHAWLGHIYVRLGRHHQARESAQRAIEHATRARDDATSGKAYGVLSFESFWSGRPREGVELGERGAALLEAEPWWQAMAHFYTAFNDAQMGRMARARASLAQMRAIGERIADNRLCNYAAWAAGWTEAVEGNGAAAIDSCEQALALATDPVSAAYAGAFLGYAYLESGDGAAATQRLTQAVEDYRRFQFRTAEAWFSALLADARRLEGRDDAGEIATRALTLAREINFPFAEGLAQRAIGRVAWARGAKDEAVRRLGEALDTFRRIEAEFEAGRTRLDLAAIDAGR